MENTDTRLTKPDVSQEAEINVYQIGYDLQNGDRRPEGRLERIAEKLCIMPSDIADVYVFGAVDNPSWVDDPQTKDMSGIEEIRYYRSQIPPNEERATLIYETYESVNGLALAHTVSAVRSMLYEYLRWTNKGEEETYLTEKLTQLIALADRGRPIKEILDEIDPPGIFTGLQHAFERHHTDWEKILEATINLYQRMETSGKDFSYRKILLRLTLLHQTIHAGGGGFLEHMLMPGKKDLGNELLLRFWAEDTKLTDFSVATYGSRRAIKLLQKDRLQRPPFSIFSPEKVSSEEEQILLAKNLLREHVLLGRIDRVAQSMQRYPIFNTIYHNIFGGILRPEDYLMEMAKNYLEAAVETNSIDPAVIVKRLAKNSDTLTSGLEVVQNPAFFASLAPETQEAVAKGIIRTLEEDDTSSKERRRILQFIELSEILDSERINHSQEEGIMQGVRKIAAAIEENDISYSIAHRILRES